MTSRKNRRRKKNKLIRLGLVSIFLIILLSSIIYTAYSMLNGKTNLVSDKAASVSNPAKDETSPTDVKVENVQQEKKEEVPAPPKVDLQPVIGNIKQEMQAEIVISSVGDNTLGNDDNFAVYGSLPEVLKRNNNDYSYFFKNVSHIFKADDITTGNLETTFTDSTKKAEKQFAFKGPTAYAKAFPLGGIEAVNLSNNHIYDYLEKGFEDTLKALETENVNYFGEGHQWISEVKGVKIGFLGYKGYWYDNNFLKKIKNDIAGLKEQTAFVVINFHWGDENSYKPNSTQKYLAHYAVDQGADLIVGHHPHVIQGLEKYKGKIIAYSMGNFAFGGNNNPKDKNTFILQAKLNFTDSKLTGYGVRAIPCSISSVTTSNDYCPTPLSGSAKDDVLKKLNELSINLDFKLSDEFLDGQNLK
jgi:hypothetical protein